MKSKWVNAFFGLIVFSVTASAAECWSGPINGADMTICLLSDSGGTGQYLLITGYVVSQSVKAPCKQKGDMLQCSDESTDESTMDADSELLT